MKTHLPGHTSEETAYFVESYPYGSLRCKIKFWLEHTPKKGFRFVSRTQNPKNGVWNAPKKMNLPCGSSSPSGVDTAAADTLSKYGVKTRIWTVCGGENPSPMFLEKN